MIPGGGGSGAIGAGNGCSQSVGGVSGDSFIDVNGDRLFARNDSDSIFVNIDSPFNSIGNVCDADNSSTLKISGGVAAGVLVHCLQIGNCASQIVIGLNFGYGRIHDRSGISSLGLSGTTACEHAEQHCQQQGPGNNLFHSKLLIE